MQHLGEEFARRLQMAYDEELAHDIAKKDKAEELNRQRPNINIPPHISEELKARILKWVKVDEPLTYMNWDQLFKTHVNAYTDDYSNIQPDSNSKALIDDLTDHFWQHNAIKLQPIPYEAYDPEDDNIMALELPADFPPLRARRQKRRVEFHESLYDPHNNTCGRKKWSERARYDNWHILTQLMNGQLEFKMLECIYVFFEADAVRMATASFEHWKIDVEVAGGRVTVDTLENGWQNTLANALQRRQNLGAGSAHLGFRLRRKSLQRVEVPDEFEFTGEDNGDDLDTFGTAENEEGSCEDVEEVGAGRTQGDGEERREESEEKEALDWQEVV